MKWLAGALLTVVLLLQYRLWLSGDGVRELGRLSEAVERQKAENEEAVDRNEQLIAEVADLKAGMAAIEERARSELGMIGRNETFYQVVPVRPKTALPTRPAEATKTAARRRKLRAHALLRRHPGRGQWPAILVIPAKAIRGAR